MLGRKNKELVIRLLKVTEPPVYHIIVTRKRSQANSRIDRIGSIAAKSPYSFLKLDLNKLRKYLMEKNVTITSTVWQYLNVYSLNPVTKMVQEQTKKYFKHEK